MQKQLVTALALLLFALSLPGEASALVQRTFVSKFGVDTNPCSATEPCRTFGAAIAQTQAGGEVIALDSAGYGPVTITQAISLISPPGVYAGITTTSPGTTAIEINAGASDVVVLKGLSLTGLGLGSLGVSFASGKALRVEGLTISGFTFRGIDFAPAATAWLTVTDTLIRDIGVTGIRTLGPPGGLIRVAINRTSLIGNVGGLSADTGSRVSVRDSVAVGNSSLGFETYQSVLNLENCVANGNGYGIYSNGLVRVAGTTVTDNATGLSGPGSILSRGNNTVEGNTMDGVFTAPFLAK